MIIKTIKSFYLNYLALLIIFYPTQINALTHEWIAVPKSQDGEQLWNQNSVKTNLDGFTRVLSKFFPKSTADITKDILYRKDINCSENPSEILR